jgi:hypothetical protein
MTPVNVTPTLHGTIDVHGGESVASPQVHSLHGEGLQLSCVHAEAACARPGHEWPLHIYPAQPTSSSRALTFVQSTQSQHPERHSDCQVPKRYSGCTGHRSHAFRLEPSRASEATQLAAAQEACCCAADQWLLSGARRLNINTVHNEGKNAASCNRCVPAAKPASRCCLAPEGFFRTRRCCIEATHRDTPTAGRGRGLPLQPTFGSPRASTGCRSGQPQPCLHLEAVQPVGDCSPAAEPATPQVGRSG